MHHSVRTTVRTIIVAVAVLLVAMWAGVGSALVSAREAALDNAKLQGRNLMIAFREEIAHILRGVDGETNLIAAAMRRERDKFDLYAWSQQIEQVSPGIARAVIVNPDGKLRSATADPHPGPVDLNDRDYFRVQLDGKYHGLFIGRTIIGRLLGIPVIPISRRVEAADGTFLGVVVILISPNALTSLPKVVDLGPHGIMTLSGIDHVILARFSADSPDGTKGIGRSIAGAPMPRVLKDGAQGWFVRNSVLDGIPRLFIYGRVGSYPLIVTVGLSLDRILAPWRSYAAIIIGLALGVTLLLIGFAAYLIRRILLDARASHAATLAVTHTAEHDFLTGLPNRMLLTDRIGQAIALAQRHQDKIAVLFMDLDGFKRINDALGHPIGDKLLQSVAQRLVASVRASDTVSRQGGDEFVALLRELHGPEDAAVIAEKMLHAVAEPHAIGEHEVCVTTSIGISLYPDDGLDAETLVKNADAAMYLAKENGRQCYRFFKPAMNLQAA